MAYTFNGPARTITIGGTGAVTITANDLYSRWVDWVHDGVGAGYDEVMRAIGGEDIGGGLTSGVYVFLGFGWSIVMPATITTLTVQGNVSRDPDDVSGAALYINQGAGLIIREVSAIALGYSSGSGLNSTQSTQLNTLYNATTAGTGATVFSEAALANTSTAVTTALTAYTVPTLAQVNAAGFTTDRNNALEIIDLRVQELYQRQGLESGVTATVIDPTVATPGSLTVREGSTVLISQTLTKPDEETVTISRNA